MKKRRVFTALLLLLLAVTIYLYWPLRFDTLTEECTSITVTYIEDSITFPAKTAVYAAGSEEFAKVVKILERYRYHRCPRTFFGDLSTDGNGAGYWLYLYLDTPEARTVILCGGTGQILVGDHLYRMGYGSNRKELDMMAQLAQILEE